MAPPIERILSQIPGWKPEGVVVTPLTAGMTNRNYRVELSGQSLVVRIGGEGTELLGIDRRHEHAAASIAARLGVGAEVVHFIEAESALITRFLEGETLTPESAARPETLERIVRCIRRYHEGPPFPGTFSPFATVRAYQALARKHGVRFPPEAGRALELLERIERALGPFMTSRPCHNDLLAGNFIDDGRKIWILDWEYAGMGDPFFDLGNFAVNQGLPPEACESLLEVYSGEARPGDLAHLHLQRLASDMRESWWGFLQVGISKIEFDYRQYAQVHLERFLRNATSPDFGRWIGERLRERGR